MKSNHKYLKKNTLCTIKGSKDQRINSLPFVFTATASLWISPLIALMNTHLTYLRIYLPVMKGESENAVTVTITIP